MNMKKHRIPAFLLSVLVAFAMTFTTGATVQNAYADDTTSGGYEIYLEGVRGVCPGETMDLGAIVKYDGQQIDPAAEGKHIEWKLSLLGPEDIDTLVESDSSSTNPDQHVKVGTDTTKAQVVFISPGTHVDTTMAIFAALVDADGTEIVRSDEPQFQLASEFNEVRYLKNAGGTEDFELDQYLLTGETQDITVSVMHHEEGKSEPLEVRCIWKVDNDGVQILNNNGEVVTEKVGKDQTFTFKRVDASKDTEVLLTVTDMDGEIIEHNCGFWFYQVSNNLADYQIEFNGKAEDDFVFVDKEDLPILDAKSKACTITVVSGNGDGHVLKEGDDYYLKIRKVLGYDENTWAPITQDVNFPLNVDPKLEEAANPKDSFNLNGERTDGTAIYLITAVAKGGRYTGQTNSESGRVWLLDRKTLTWPAVDAGFPESSYNPYEMRYEAKVGKTLTPYAKSTETFKELTLNKDYTVEYVSKKNNTPYKSFPTKAGEYKVIFKGIDPYYGQNDNYDLLVGKKNPVKVKAKTVVCKTKMKKGKTKKSRSFKASSAFKVTKAKGTVSYSKVSGNKNITVDDNGKITVKKGTKKGTYKIKVEVTAQGNSTYIAGRKTVTVKVRVR